MADYDKLLENLGELAEKHPELVSALRRAKETERELEQLRLKTVDLEDQVTKWNQWYEDNWDHERNMTKSEAYYIDRLAQLEEELQKFRGNMNQTQTGTASSSEIQEKFENLYFGGYLSKDEAQMLINQAIEDRVSKKQLDETIKNIVVAFSKVVPGMMEASARHQKEFNEPLSGQQLWEFMTKNNIDDPVEAYEKMTAERRQRTQEELIQKKIQEAEERGRMKERQEMAMKSGKLPTDMEGSVPAHIRRKLTQSGSDESPEVPPNAKLGDGILAAAWTQKYLKRQTS